MSTFNRTTRGFTLIELLVVISIIALLSSVILGSLNSARAKSRDSQRLQAVVQMRTALELYAADHDGKYPLNTLNGSYFLGWIGSGTGCYNSNATTDGFGGYVMADGLVSGKYISKLPADPNPLGAGNCMKYYVTSTGNEYKFLVSGTMESFNPATTNHPLKDPKGRSKSISVQTPIDPEDVP
jgi:prepilin-type N-terminal cleavage/methylation domain-containing protein